MFCWLQRSITSGATRRRTALMASAAADALVVQLNAAVDGRMIHDAARKRLVGVLAQIEIDAETAP